MHYGPTISENAFSRAMVRLFLCLLLGALAMPAARAADGFEAYNTAWSAYEAYVSQGLYDQAIPYAAEARRLAASLEPGNQRLHARLSYIFGVLYVQADDQARAEATLTQALDQNIVAFGPESEDVVRVHGALAALYLPRDGETAHHHYQQALDILAVTHGTDHPDIAPYLRGVAAVRMSDRDLSGASETLRHAVAITRNAGPAHQLEYGMAMVDLARIDIAMQRYAPAVTKLEGALGAFEAMPQPDNAMIQSAHTLLVQGHEQAGNDEAATRHAQRLATPASETETTEPEPLFRIAPAWPARALQHGNSGHVVVSFTIDPEGRVKDEQIVESKPGRLFAQQGLDAVRRFRFKPRVQDGEFVDAPDQSIRLVWRYDD